MAWGTLQTVVRRVRWPEVGSVEQWLEAERDQLALWVPVALGVGIASWFALPGPRQWIAVIFVGSAIMCAGVVVEGGTRLRGALLWSGFLIVTGCALIWARAEWTDPRPISRAVTTEFTGRIERVEQRGAEGKIRLTVAVAPDYTLPPRVRVSVANGDSPDGLANGDVVKLRARLMPPAEPPVPGGYNFARTAWFKGIGATGRALGNVERIGPANPPGLRERLSAHVRSQLDGSEGGIAAAFASGDRGGISPEVEEQMRASGLTHLLSISGLHITAVVGAAMLLTLRLLALSPWLALRWPLLLIAAGAGAAAGVGYTLLTGAEVPTIRSCIAALLVLAGIALGREALTLRLIATGALIVLLLIPESLAGASFQLSFAAITAIVALHETRWVKALVSRRDEGPIARSGRLLLSLLLTGIAVEIALAPIALYHFHKSGLYGALANIVAIPLTTFFIMPMEALALIFDVVGLGAPFWWATGKGLALLLWLATSVAETPGAVASVPRIPDFAFAAMISGGLWIMLWRTRSRLLGLLPLTAGALAAMTTPAPDLLVTGDGRHLAVRGETGLALLRDRAGDYVRGTLGEHMGDIAPASALDDFPGARCSRDVCLIAIKRGQRNWRIAATRTGYRLPWRELTMLCASVDIMVSDRRLPRACTPRWIKADPTMLSRTGGLAIYLDTAEMRTVHDPSDRHPWLLSTPKVDEVDDHAPLKTRSQ